MSSSKHEERTAWIWAASAAGMALTGGVAWATWRQSGQAWSGFADWLAAWATLFGVGAAIVAGFYAARAFRLESERERRAGEQQVRAQASLVAAWWGEGPMPPDANAARRFMGPPSGVFLRNASEVPVTEVSVSVRRPDSGTMLEKMDVGILGPTSESVLRAPSRDTWDLYRAMPDGVRPNVTLSFRDAAGARWVRTPDGALTQVSHPTPDIDLLHDG